MQCFWKGRLLELSSEVRHLDRLEENIIALSEDSSCPLAAFRSCPWGKIAFLHRDQLCSTPQVSPCCFVLALWSRRWAGRAALLQGGWVWCSVWPQPGFSAVLPQSRLRPAALWCFVLPAADPSYFYGAVQKRVYINEEVWLVGYNSYFLMDLYLCFLFFWGHSWVGNKCADRQLNKLFLTWGWN